MKIHRIVFAVAPICKQIQSIGNKKEENVTPSLFKVPDELYGTQKHETISLVCVVEANPTEVSFHWTFNNSGDLNDISSTQFTSDNTVSKLNYTPEDDKDYGTLGCWAKNDLGYSKQPCLYQITAVGMFARILVSIGIINWGIVNGHIVIKGSFRMKST